MPAIEPRPTDEPSAAWGGAARRARWAGRAASALVYVAAVVIVLGPSLAGARVALPHDILLSQLPWSATAAGGQAPRNPELRDTIDTYYPVQGELVRRVRAGQDVTWMPEVGFGLPGIQFVGWGALSPFTLGPGLVLPFDLAWSWGQALRLLAAMAGAHLLARAYGAGLAGATVAGLSFGLSGYMVGWLGWPQSHVGALLPWVCWAAVRTAGAARGDGRWWAPPALAVTTAGLWLGGFPAVAVYGLLAGGIVALHAASRAPPPGLSPGGWGGLAVALAAVAVGTLLVGATLVPSVAFLGEVDLGARLDAWQARVFPMSLWTFLVPGLFGDHVHDPRWIGSAYVETIGYAGVVTLLLAVPAWLLAPRRSGLWLWTGLGVGFGLLAYGFPPLQALVQVLPGLSTNPPNRVLALVGLAIAVVGGFGADALLRWLRRKARPGRRAVAVAAGLAALTAAALILLRPVRRLAELLAERVGDPQVRAAVAAASWDEALTAMGFVAAAAAVVLGAWVVARHAPATGGRLAGGALVVVVAADLLTFAGGWNTQVPRTGLFPDAPGVEAAQRAGPARVAGAGGVGLGNVNLRYPGWADLRARGFLTARQRAVLRDSGAVFSSPTNWDLSTAGAADWDPWLPVAGVTAVLTPQGAPVPDGWPVEDLPGEGPGVQLVEVPGALPRVHAVGDAIGVEDDDAADGDEAAAAVVEAGPEALAAAAVVEAMPGAQLPPLPSGGRAEVAGVRRDGGRLAATVTSDGGAILVVRDAALPGWTATVSGEDAPVVVADHLFVGVVVPAGTHEVALDYRPPGLGAGWTLSAAGLAGLLALGWLSSRRNARP